MTTTSTEQTVGRGFNLVMQLVNPPRLPDLMKRLGDEATRKRIDTALAALDYVHYARFLPLWDQGVLMIITEFDGQPEDYVKDFAAVLDDEFSMILGYMKGQPRLPVSRFPDEFWEYVAVFRDNDDRVARKQSSDRDALAVVRGSRERAVDRQHQRNFGVPRRALSNEVEVSELNDLIAPEFHADRLGHPEAVDVEDSSSHAELRDVFDHRHALEPDGLEMQREIFRAARVALAKLEAGERECARQLRSLEEGTRRGEENPHTTSGKLLERFNTLAGDLSVRLDLSKTFSRRIQRDRQCVVNRFEIGEPSLRCGNAFGYDNKKATRVSPAETGDYHTVAGTWETREVYTRGQGRKNRSRARELVECLYGLG